MSQPAVEPTPIVATPVGASAFDWSNVPRATVPQPEERISRIEAAKRGPTPDNPSASLKKRLARAAFFDRREQLVAAGEAAPMDSMAGLPEAMDPVEPPRGKPAMRTSFKRRFQAA